jgi:hypothetical protein
LLMSLWRFVCLWPCHVWHTCNVGWCQSLVPFVNGGHFHLFLLDSLLLHSSRRRCEVADCGMINGTMRNHVVQLGVPICRTAVLWWTWWSSFVIVEFHIPWFQALLWLHMDSIQKRPYSKGLQIMMLTNYCGWVVSLILGNDGGIPLLSLWTKWTSRVIGSYERPEYGRFFWALLLWYLWIYWISWCSHESWRKRSESVVLWL